MTTHNQLRQALSRFDPYGFMQVSAAQSLYIALGLYIINFAFALPDFNTIVVAPVFGFIAISLERSFDKRIKYMFVFSVIVLLYSLLLTIVQNYRYLLVFTVGICVLSMFALSKKYTYLLIMIPLIHALAYTFLILPFGGDWSSIYIFMTSYFIIMGASLALMLFFPRIYFFRVWLRSLHLTLQELETKLREFTTDNINYEHYVSLHLLEMQDFAYALSYKEYGFNARKISLRCVSFYTFIVAVLNGYQPVTKEELLELADMFSQFHQVIPDYKPLENVTVSTSHNKQIIQLNRKLLRAIREWNRLCPRL